MARLWCTSLTSIVVYFSIPPLVLLPSPDKPSRETSCERVPSTACKFSCDSGKNVIDLSTIDGSSDQARYAISFEKDDIDLSLYKALVSQKKLKLLKQKYCKAPISAGIKDIRNPNISYLWNPCTRFSGGCKESVNVCQMNRNGKDCNLGDSGPTVVFDDVQQQYYMLYLGPVRQALGEAKTTVYLEYDSHSIARTSRMTNYGNFFGMTLYTKYAPHPNGKNESDNGLSTGTVFLIIFFGVLVLYLSFGMFFKKYKKGAHGKEIIPNYEIWSEIPSLAKDGCSYSVKLIERCGSNVSSKVTSRRAYEEI